MTRKIYVLSALLTVLCTIGVHAQTKENTSPWAIGLSGGWSYNVPSIDKGYATDYQYKGRSGYNVGIIGRYQFLDWLAVRADLRLTSRCYRMERNLQVGTISKCHTYHRDLYLHLPVMADLSFGVNKFRGHVYLGGYIGHWMSAHRSGLTNDTNGSAVWFDESTDFDSRRDNRFNAGLLGGLGASYEINPTWEVMLEGFYMYDLTKSNKTNSVVANPRYNSTTDVNVGVMYNF